MVWTESPGSGMVQRDPTGTAVRLKLTLSIDGVERRVDIGHAIDLSIPIDPHGPHPRFFCDAQASAAPLRSGDFVGRVAEGGAANAEWIHFLAHCHGTHTECAGHLSARAQRVGDQLANRPWLAQAVSLTGVEPNATGERYALPPVAGETLLTCADLRAACGAGLEAIDALVIRTLPNDADKRERNYSQHPVYPVLTEAAMLWLAQSGLTHLLIDTPSVDRAHDDGRLANHRQWWGYDDQGDIARPERGITEMIFVPDEARDGLYLLDLQLAPFVSDATPSRPLLFPLHTA